MRQFLDNSRRRLQRLLGTPTADSIELVPRRFLQAFHDHGVEPAQIPRLLPELKLADLRTDDTLLAALTPVLLDKTADLFGIRRAWLEGSDDEIYPGCFAYKEPRRLLDHLAAVRKFPPQPLDFPLRVLTTTLQLDYRDEGQQLLAPLLLEPIADLDGKTVYRYHVYRDGFDWGYAPTRIELKAIAWLAFHRLRATVPLFEISPHDMDAVLAGRRIPADLFRTGLITNPSLEDFILTPQESRVAKECDELPDVLAYLAEQGLSDYHFEAPPPATPEPPPEAAVEALPPSAQAEPATRQNPGKRAASQQDWRELESVAVALWASSGPPPSIADMIRRLKKMPQLRAASNGESAIRKHIAPLAPPTIRGKPGRKPKKSA